jgi:hypothetical protein
MNAKRAALKWFWCALLVLATLAGTGRAQIVIGGDPPPDPPASPCFDLDFNPLQINPPSGNFYQPFNVSITNVCDPWAVMRYTLDDREPVETDPIYTPDTVIRVEPGSNLVVKVRMWTGGLDGETHLWWGVDARYSFVLPAPLFSPPSGVVSNGTLLTISCSTTGATISYAFPPSQNWLAYTGAVVLNTNLAIWAKAEKPGYEAALSLAVYELPRLPRPDFSPVNGPITNGTRVTITSSVPDALIRYTLDDSIPTESSPIYTEPLSLNGGARLRAYAYKEGYNASHARYTFYTAKTDDISLHGTNSTGFFSPRYTGANDILIYAYPDPIQFVLPPFNYPTAFTFMPPRGIYESAQLVSISSAYSPIRYTLDGRVPTDSDPIFDPARPIQIDGNTIITAGFFADSERAAYTFRPNLMASPSPGVVPWGTEVTISSATTNAEIQFAFGSAGPFYPYSVPIPILSNTTLVIMGTKPGYDTNYVTNIYTLPPLPRPEFTPASGPVTNGTEVAIRVAEPGSLIRYTLDGTEPTEQSAKYTGPIRLTAHTPLRARAYHSRFNPSPVRSQFFRVVQPGAPVIKTIPTEFPRVRLVTVAGAERPVWITHAGDGTKRLFVVEQGGTIRIVGETGPFFQFSQGYRAPEPGPGGVIVLGDAGPPPTSTSRVASLVGLAFPPDYDSKAWFYVSCFDFSGQFVVLRFTALANPDVADVGSEQVVAVIPGVECRGGQIVFAPDGTLYVNRTGPIANAQLPGQSRDLNALSGKMQAVLNERGLPLPGPVATPSWPFDPHFSATNCSVVGGVFVRAASSRLTGAFLHGTSDGSIWAAMPDGDGWQNQLLSRVAIRTTVLRNTFQNVSLPGVRPLEISAIGEDEDGNAYVAYYGTSVTVHTLNETYQNVEGGLVLRVEDDLEHFKLHGDSIHGGRLAALEWFAADGRVYQVQESPDLAHWTDIMTPIVGAGEVITIPRPARANLNQQFYRVVLQAE